MTRSQITVLGPHDFLRSALTFNNRFQNTKKFREWFDRKKKTEHFLVEQIPFAALKQWHFDAVTHNLRHASGRFFTIEGIRIQTNFGSVQTWDQPIINQPEIGILGIITKRFDGIPYFLMQVKMEPGNINLLQLSPTVQATKSNFSQVHGGKLPPYLEFFLDRNKARFVVDQLQTEQGGRFLRKRNRNMIVEVEHDIDVLDDFCWLTLGQIKELLQEDNFVNMDARSVLSCIPIPRHINVDALSAESAGDATQEIQRREYSKNLFDSMTCSDAQACHTTDELISWFTSLKTHYYIEVERIPLKSVKNWKKTDVEIAHSAKPFFSVIAVSVEAGSREVFSWTQPLLKEQQQGLLGFITKKIKGIVHLLVQAKVEAGNIDSIEIAPTVSCSAVEFKYQHGQSVPLLNFFIHAPAHRIRYSAVQSEEGGRFFCFLNRNMIIELDETDDIDFPKEYIWMTLGQAFDFLKHGYMNIDARTLIACINLHT